MNKTLKLASVISLNLALSAMVKAENIFQKKLNFEVKSEELMKGDIQYSLRIMDSEKLNSKYPGFKELDALDLRKRKDVSIILSKAAFTVKKPMGFFDHQNMVDEKFVQHMYGKANVTKIDRDSYKIIDGKSGQDYELGIYFDSDDVSTLPSSKTIQAIMAAKKLDVVVQSAPSMVLHESDYFSKTFEGEISIEAYAPLKENKTLVIVYKFFAIKKSFNDSRKIKAILLEKISQLKKKTDQF